MSFFFQCSMYLWLRQPENIYTTTMIRNSYKFAASGQILCLLIEKHVWFQQDFLSISKVPLVSNGMQGVNKPRAWPKFAYSSRQSQVTIPNKFYDAIILFPSIPPELSGFHFHLFSWFFSFARLIITFWERYSLFLQFAFEQIKALWFYSFESH